MSLLSKFYESKAASLYHSNRQAAMQWINRIGSPEAAGDFLCRMGDHSAAAAKYEEAGLLSKAADAARKSGNLRRAAELLKKAGDIAGAKALLEQAGDVDAVVELCLEAGNKAEAARAYEKSGRRSQAAAIYADMGDFDSAIRLYREAGNHGGLLNTYKRRGDLGAAAAECAEKNEPVLAAALYELDGQYSKAADIVAEEHPDKAVELYEKAGMYDRVGAHYEGCGKLDLAAAAYEKISDKALECARIFARLVVLQEASTQQFETGVVSGRFARNADAFAMASVNRDIIYGSGAFVPAWVYRISGDCHPCAVALPPDGSLVAVGIEKTGEDGANSLMVLNRAKQVAWQADMPEPVRDVTFLSDAETLAALCGETVTCFGKDGSPVWTQTVDFKAWSADYHNASGRLAVGTLGGSFFIFDSRGQITGRAKRSERVHSVRIGADGKHIVAGTGDSGIVLIDIEGGQKWVANLEHRTRLIDWLPGQQMVIAVGAQEVSVLDMEGAVVSHFSTEQRILGAFPDHRNGVYYLATENRAVTGYKPADCKQKAADNYVRAGKLREAADIFQQIEQYKSAYDLFTQIGDYERAADTVELAGDKMTAARHYEVVGRFDKAAQLYEELEQPAMAARCWGKGGQHLKAARLFDELGDVILAADLYERAGCYKDAALLFRRARQSERAISNYEAHLKTEATDSQAQSDLGHLYLEADRFDEAIRLLQPLAQEEAFSRDALKALGQCFLGKSMYDIAIDRVQEALGAAAKPSKDNIDLFYDLGCCYEAAGRYPEAKDIYGKIIAVDYYYLDARQKLQHSEEMSAAFSKPGAAPPEPPVMGVARTTVIEAEKPQRYKIVRKLGQGGMGVVYLALDTLLNRQVAWKVLPSHLASDKEFQDRMLREARAAAQLVSPYIVAVHDICVETGDCHITMEYVEGRTLRDRMREKPQLPVEEAVRYASQIAEALEAAHRAGVVHRDIKPENIMLTSAASDVKVLDFGLARLGDNAQLTREGCVVGTVAYMAPEQIMAKEMDGRTDIYALGVVLFEMLAGRAPFIGDNVLAQHLNLAPPDLRELRADVPDNIASLAAACLAKERENRPASCKAVVHLLAGDHPTEVAPAPREPEKPEPPAATLADDDDGAPLLEDDGSAIFESDPPTQVDEENPPAVDGDNPTRVF